MRGLDDSRESLTNNAQAARSSAARGWSAFANFALNDNVLEVAIGLMYV
jgi:hypothetical protein